MPKHGGVPHTRILPLAAFALTNTPLDAITYDCTGLDLPGAPTGINNNGVSVGMWGDIHTFPGTIGYFTRDPAGNFTTVTIPAPYNGSLTTIHGINDDGAISGASPSGNFILNSDGTATAMTAAPGTGVPGSNALQLLETQTPFATSSPAAALVTLDNTVTPIAWNHPGGSGPTAFGLNNSGTAVGFVGLYLKAPPFGPPWRGFVRDAAGTFSDVVCNIPANTEGATPWAVSDNGVVVGTFGADSTAFIATPRPGLAQFNSSVPSLDFGQVYTSQTNPPLTFTISNSGDARLDIASIAPRGFEPPFAPPEFANTACISQGNPTSSLDPGESCVVSMTAVPANGETGPASDVIVVDDSAPGSPHTIPVSANAVPAPPPPCGTDVTAQFQVNRGGFRYQRDGNGGGQFVQTITLQQLTQTTLQPPINVVLDSLSSNAQLFTADGATSCTQPAGSLYQGAGAPQSNVVFRFIEPNLTGITYTLRVLAGGTP